MEWESFFICEIAKIQKSMSLLLWLIFIKRSSRTNNSEFYERTLKNELFSDRISDIHIPTLHRNMVFRMLIFQIFNINFKEIKFSMELISLLMNLVFSKMIKGQKDRSYFSQGGLKSFWIVQESDIWMISRSLNST